MIASESAELTANFIKLIGVTSLCGCIVALCALLLHRLMIGKVKTGWLNLLWLMVVIRFALLVVPSSSLSALNLLSTENESELPVHVGDAGLISGIIDASPSLASDAIAFEFVALDDGGSFEHDRRKPQAVYTINDLLLLLSSVWLAGFLLLVVRLARSLIQVRRVIRSADPSTGIQQRLDRLNAGRITFFKPTVRVTADLPTPAMFGVVRPVILLPTWCTEELNRVQLDHVLAHELVHARRLDALIQSIAHLIAAVHWFNPLVWMSLRFAEACRELSCDEQAVKLLENSGQHKTTVANQFATTIIDVAARAALNPQNQRQVASVVGSFTDFNTNLITQRIAMLTTQRKPVWLLTLLFACSTLTLLATGFTAAQTDAKQQPKTGKATGNNELSNSMSCPPKTESPRTFSVPQYFKKGETRETLTIAIGSKKRIELNADCPEIANHNPNFIDAKPVAANEIEVEGLSAGEAELDLQLIKINNGQTRCKYLVRVVPDTNELNRLIAARFPGIETTAAGTTKNTVRLSGRVNKGVSQSIEEFAKANTELVVENQILEKASFAMKVRIYEINKSKLSKLGVDFSSVTKNNDGLKEQHGFGSLLSSQGNALVLESAETDEVHQFVSQLEKKGLAKLIEQPALVSRHSVQAEFRSGGEIPIEVRDKDGKKQIEFRQYGTMLSVTPMRDQRGNTLIEMQAERSEIAKDLSVVDGVPAFRVRRVNTGMMLKDDQSVALAFNFRDNPEDHKDACRVLITVTPRELEAVAQRQESAELR